MTDPPHRRRGIAVVALLCVLGASGCLTLSPTVTSTPTESPVFERISTTEPWAGRSLATQIRLKPNATTAAGVTQLVVLSESGSSFYTTTVDSGQTSVTAYLPTNQNVTLVAVNAVNGTVVDTWSVRTGGNTVF